MELKVTACVLKTFVSSEGAFEWLGFDIFPAKGNQLTVGDVILLPEEEAGVSIEGKVPAVAKVFVYAKNNCDTDHQLEIAKFAADQIGFAHFRDWRGAVKGIDFQPRMFFAIYLDEEFYNKFSNQALYSCPNLIRIEMHGEDGSLVGNNWWNDDEGAYPNLSIREFECTKIISTN